MSRIPPRITSSGRLSEYRDENTRTGKPKNEALIARIQSVALAAVRSVYTDDAALFPAAGETIWWEIWLRHGHAESFDAVIQRLEIPAQAQRLVFPDREVRLIYGSEITVARLFVNTDSIAEIRRARDTPAQFMHWSNVAQAARAADLAGRVDGPENPRVAVCILDTGVTQSHPLLSLALDPGDVQAYDPTWPGGDSHGHGTNMAGSALYGDLTPLFAGNGRVPLTHCLESVKILPDQGQNEPKLYGAIARESIARAEVQAPERRRAVCMAVTSDVGTNRGIPSSWSAAVDQLCFGEDDARRLILVSAGNIREGLVESRLSARNEIEPIENPAQAWNAITVGAFTDKSVITDPTYEGWEPVAPVGDLCPTSRTSVALGTEVAAETGHCARRRKLGGTGRSDRLSGRPRPPDHVPGSHHPSLRHLSGHQCGNGPRGESRRQDHRGHAAALARDHSGADDPLGGMDARDETKVRCRGFGAAETRSASEVRIRRARLLPRRFERSQRSDADRGRQLSAVSEGRQRDQDTPHESPSVSMASGGIGAAW